MENQHRGYFKFGKFGKEECFRHIKVYRPIKEEP